MKADYNMHPRSKIGLDYIGLDQNDDILEFKPFGSRTCHSTWGGNFNC